MPLNSTDLLAPHFAASELGADNPDIPDVAVANLRATATWLEAARTVLGVPLVVTSGYRDPTHNAAVGGASDSDHMTGLAADFVPQGLTKLEAFTKLQNAIDAGLVPGFDQLIYYVLDDHIHVGLGVQLRAQVLYETVEGGVKRYAVLSRDLATRFWGSLPGRRTGLVAPGRCHA